MARTIAIYDSTLRDGAQAQGISFSLEDKLKIVRVLDEMGVAYIEAGNPGSNPKDLEFFHDVPALGLRNSRLVAFGATRRKNLQAEDDQNLLALAQANVPAAAVFGKTWDFHVTDILKATLDQNLEMIADTVVFLKKAGKEVIFDAEHFFDGWKANPDYAMSALDAAAASGADSIALCDTNGGAFSDEVAAATTLVLARFPKIPIGIHTHNDGGMAVANAIASVEAGASQVQGTWIGFGERCGNANLSTVIANLQIKRGMDCIPADRLPELTGSARFIAEIANVTLDEFMPYVGANSFSHKGGMHVDAVQKSTRSFEHISPESVGNQRNFLLSEVAGRSALLPRIKKIAPHLDKDSPETQRIIDRVKAMEHDGYELEGADATLELIVRKELGKYRPFFVLEAFRIIGEEPTKDAGLSAAAMVTVSVDGRREVTAAEGNGPVNAMDFAIRKALEIFYPELKSVRLIDYKVRVLNGRDASAARVRVLIESSDGNETWSTVGVSSDIIDASRSALVDSLEYKLLKNIEGKLKVFF
jgi:2-isopropylmalate synthase